MPQSNPDFRAVRVHHHDSPKKMSQIYQRLLDQGRAHKTKLPDTPQGVENLRDVLRRNLIAAFSLDMPGEQAAGAIFLSPLVTDNGKQFALGTQLEDIVVAPQHRGHGLGSFGLAAAAVVAHKNGAVALGLECEEGMEDEAGRNNARFYAANGLRLRTKLPYRLDAKAILALTEEAADRRIRVQVASMTEADLVTMHFKYAAKEQSKGAALIARHDIPLDATYKITAYMARSTSPISRAVAVASRRWSAFRTAKNGDGLSGVLAPGASPTGFQIDSIHFSQETAPNEKLPLARAVVKGLAMHMHRQVHSCSFIDLIGTPGQPFQVALVESVGAKQNTYSGGALEQLWTAQGIAFETLRRRLNARQVALK